MRARATFAVIVVVQSGRRRPCLAQADSIIETWNGTSACVDHVHFPACNEAATVQVPRGRLRLVLEVWGTAMTGSLTEVETGRQVRRIELRRAAGASARTGAMPPGAG